MITPPSAGLTQPGLPGAQQVAWGAATGLPRGAGRTGGGEGPNERVQASTLTVWPVVSLKLPLATWVYWLVSCSASC